jgi:hypothetical protein
MFNPRKYYTGFDEIWNLSGHLKHPIYITQEKQLHRKKSSCYLLLYAAVSYGLNFTDVSDERISSVFIVLDWNLKAMSQKLSFAPLLDLFQERGQLFSES